MILPFFLAVLLAGCASSTKTSNGGSNDQAIQIRFKGQSGAESVSDYYNASRILTYSEGQLVKDRTEAVDFTVLTKVKKADAGTIEYSVTTTRKDGVVPLHDLAFPEKDQSLDYIIKTTGEILKAGQYPPNSIFFVPSVPIPKDEVQIGDTWALEHVWSSKRDGIPLKLAVTAILKDIVACEGKSRCADIEISGHVRLLVPPSSPGSKFESRIWGRMLFSLSRGDILWSETRSREEMATGGERIAVNSCMVSRMRIGAPNKLTCDVKEEPITAVPRF